MSDRPQNEAAFPSPHSVPSLHAIIERAPLPTVEVQGKTHIVFYVNAAFCNLLEKPRKDLIGKSFCEIVPKGQECLPILDRVYETGEASMLAQKDEVEPAHWLYAMWPALDEDERPVGVIIQLTKAGNFRQNIAEVNEALLISGLRQHEMTQEAEHLNTQLQNEIIQRKQAEGELRDAQKLLKDHAQNLEKTVLERTAELKDTNEQLSAFVYSIAHDLRAPLRSMQGFSQMLVDDYAPLLDDVGRNFLSRIKISSEFMDKMILDLLAFGSVGRTETKLEVVHVHLAWGSAIYQYAMEIEQTGAQIETIGALSFVCANQATLAQVLANLLSNAMKFVPAGVPPNIRFWAEDRGKMVRLWMEDNGVGISIDHQERIFHVFERLHGWHYPGTGIGLSIVRKGVERMGGKAGVESQPGAGSKFWIELQKA